MTQRALATFIGGKCSQGRVTHFEKGSRHPSEQELEKIMEVFPEIEKIMKGEIVPPQAISTRGLAIGAKDSKLYELRLDGDVASVHVHAHRQDAIVFLELVLSQLKSPKGGDK